MNKFENWSSSLQMRRLFDVLCPVPNLQRRCFTGSIDIRVYWDVEAKKKRRKKERIQAGWSQGTLHSSMLLPPTDTNKRNQLNLLGCCPGDFHNWKVWRESKRFGTNKVAEDKLKWQFVVVFGWHWPQDNFHILCSSHLFLYFQTVLVSLFFLFFILYQQFHQAISLPAPPGQ